MRPKPYIEGRDACQVTFAPECLDELITPENPVRFIAAFVDSLYLAGHGFVRAIPAQTGKPAYDPRCLLKLYIYGYIHKIRSSRKLEREAYRNIELWWLLGKLTPDHNTIADFRKDNARALRRVFRTFVHLCADLRLIGGKQVCIDGTKIRASNGRKQATSRELTEKKLAYAKAQLEIVEAYLADLDRKDIDQGRLSQPFALDIDPEHLPDREELKRRIAQHEAHLAEMEERGENQLTFTDAECRVMHMHDGASRPAYNIQTATDTAHHLITEFEVTDACNDMGQIYDTANAVRETLGVPVVSVIMDKGYESGKDIERCVLNGIIPDVGFKYDRDDRAIVLDYEEAEITEQQRVSTEAEDIKVCLRAGVLPACYEGSNIRVEVQEQTVTSCFIRHEDGRVTCPMGKELFFQGKKKHGCDYGSKEACRTCPNRCTDGKQFKVVRFGSNTHYVPVIMYGNAKYPLQKIPEIEQNTPYNAFGRVKRKPKRVMVFIRRDKAKQKLRMQVSEHPFGTVKFYQGAYHFLCRGKEKVGAEMALSFLAYNMIRAVNLVGVPGILTHLCRKREGNGAKMGMI